MTMMIVIIIRAGQFLLLAARRDELLKRRLCDTPDAGKRTDRVVSNKGLAGKRIDRGGMMMAVRARERDRINAKWRCV